MKFDSNVRYAKSHEWARKDGDAVVCGISDYAQDSLGDVVFVELPDSGKSIDAGAVFGVVESVKAASDVYMPIEGEVLEHNQALADNPSLVNEDPFGAGWLIKIKPKDVSQLESLMSTDEYESFTQNLDE